jgi:glycogen debranching enzyme
VETGNYCITDLRIVPRDFQACFEALKEGELFLTTLPDGEIPDGNLGGLGFYYYDTRFLSCFENTLAGHKLVLLSSTNRRGHFGQIELTNPEIVLPGGENIPLQSIHLRLLRVVKGSFYQRLRLINFNEFPVTMGYSMSLAADFVDIFEVRGTTRPRRGYYHEGEKNKDTVTLSYQGLDGVRRFTEIVFEPPPVEINIVEKNKAVVNFQLYLPPQKKVYLSLRVTPYIGERTRSNPASPVIGFSSAAIDQSKNHREWKEKCTSYISDNQVFNQIINRAVSDLRSLYTTRAEGSVVEAGIPWFAAPFGRDALITSWQTLALNPDLAKKSLRYLACYQGKKIDQFNEERPGKIMHELRYGEMTACGESVHNPYFGSVDSTLLFVILLAEVYNWTGDRSLIEDLKGALLGCLKWCRKYGDLDGDGYIEYLSESPCGLVNQGWKDSWNGVIDSDGKLPSGPIALVEVQAYCYKALQGAAGVLEALGDKEKALELRKRAARLQEQFLRDFWVPGEDYLVFALNGDKRPVKTVVSNMGHCLFTGILPADKALKVTRRLFQADMYSGWGVRTMSTREKAYNPMSYHNGSVWPHDNSIIAGGLRKYNLLTHLEQLFSGIYESSLYFPYHRLPELFCGFTRRPIGGPVRYPIACDPQAWAVGSTFLFLQSSLGLSSTPEGLMISKPQLPTWLNSLLVENLRVGGGKVDVEFTRSRGRTYCQLLRKEGDVRVIVDV